MPLFSGPRPAVDALGHNVDGSRDRACLSRFVALVLLAGLLGLFPLAHASPADPAWIPGFYDDADHDDVVLFLTNLGVTLDRPPEGARHLGFVVGLLLRLSASAPSCAPVLAFHLRSPPTA